MKRIIVLTFVLLSVLFVLSCAPQPSEEDALAELEELSDEDLDAALAEEEGAVAGQAIYKAPAAVKKTVSLFKWESCSETDAGADYGTAGTTTLSYTYAGKQSMKGYSDRCLNETILIEYSCAADNSYRRSTQGCPNGCINGACYQRVTPPTEIDSDADGVGDSRDLCPATSAGHAVDANGCSDLQVDKDSDSICNAGASSSGPSACTGSDNCLGTANADQVDTDTDGVGDACEPSP
ncbi:MAG: hypothetical protein Q8R53_01565 [Nanoarchaeota archaeon]|nr:hypothetical protein [Nanoarchaeota archaeon]